MNLDPFISKTNQILIDKYISHYTHTKEEYNEFLYHTIGILMCTPHEDKRKCIQMILTQLHTGSFTVWNQPIYSHYKNLEYEQDEFLNNPIEVEEGVLQCSKCGSKRTISFTRQTRSSDESTSVFAQCVECKQKWRES